MALQYSPKIVTDSLVMCLDASNNKSYPTDLPVKNGLVMWMDAADDTTFSYSSGTTVSQWRDKSGFNYHMVPVSAGPTRNAFLNSRKVLAFTTSQDIQNLTIDLRTSAYTIFVVDRYTNAASGTQRILTANPGNAGSNWLLGHHGGSADRYFAEGWVYASGTFTDVIWRLYMGDWSSATTDLANFYNNGTSLASNSTNASGGPYSLGINAHSGERSNCEAAEIIVFNRVLSTAERRLVHTYLGQKWGISNTDRSIVDLSGNNNHGLLGNGTVANMPDYNYYNKSLTYNKGQSDTLVVTNSTSLKNNNTTIELYMKFNSAITSNTGDYIQMGIGSGNNGQYYFRNDSPNLTWNWYPASSASSNSPYAISNFSTDTYYLITLTGDSAGASQMYVNGIQVASAAGGISAVTTWTSNNLTIGGYFWDGYSNSDIALTRIYSRVLSAAEISQNYEAIKSRFANTIVQQGLVLNLDAGNPYSYAGSGATWYDVSGNSYNGTLVGSPSYTSTNNGGIIFDSTAKYVTLPATVLAFGTGQFAIEAWVYSTAAVSYNHIYSSQSSNVVGFISLYYQNGYGFSVADLGNSAVRTATTHQTTVSQNTWYHVVGIRNSSNQYVVYVNGIVSTTNATSSYPLTAAAPQLASNPASNTERFTGTIASFRLYTRSLSATEVLQNYNATKGRFGL